MIWPVAAAACFSSSRSGPVGRPRWRRPTAIAPEEVERKARALARAVKARGHAGRIHRLSGVSGKGVDQLIEAAFAAIEAHRAASPAATEKSEAAS